MIEFMADLSNLNPIEEMDRRWRTVIQDIPMTPNFSEFLICKFLVLHQAEIPQIAAYPYIYAWEFPTKLHNPRDIQKLNTTIDLILTNGKNAYLLIEFKHIPDITEGNHNRTAKRKYVQEQAQQKFQIFHDLHPDWDVKAVAITNENLEKLGLGYNLQEFINREWQKAKAFYKCDIPGDLTDMFFRGSNH